MSELRAGVHQVRGTGRAEERWVPGGQHGMGFGEVTGATLGCHGRKFSPDIVLTGGDLGRCTWYSLLLLRASPPQPSPSARHSHQPGTELSRKLRERFQPSPLTSAK